LRPRFQTHDYSQEACLKRGLIKIAFSAAGPQVAQVILDGAKFDESIGAGEASLTRLGWAAGANGHLVCDHCQCAARLCRDATASSLDCPQGSFGPLNELDEQAEQP